MPVTALINGTLVDGTGAPPREGCVLVLEDGRIADIASSPPAAADCQVDVRGCTVLFGLIDGHMHVTSMPGLLDEAGHPWRPDRRRRSAGHGGGARRAVVHADALYHQRARLEPSSASAPHARAHAAGPPRPPVGVRRAHELGLRIAVGTDGGPGSVMHEVTQLVSCGLSPMEAIVAATRTTAQCLGIEAETGTLEPGKLADVLVVRGDPLEHIGLLAEAASIRLVLRAGRPAYSDAIRLP